MSVPRPPVFKAVSGWLTQFVASLVLSLLLAVLPASLSARIMLELEDGLALSFEAGNFNANTLSGEIYKVGLWEYGDLVAEADRLLMRSKGRAGDSDFVIQRLEIEGLIAWGSGSEELFIETIEARDLPVGWLVQQNPMAVLNPTILNGQQTGFRLENLTMLAPSEGVALQAARMEASDWRFDQMDNGAIYISQLRFDMPDIRLLPFGDSQAAAEFDLTLSEAGLSELLMDISGRSAIRRARQVLESETSFLFNVAGLASLATELRFEMDEAIYAQSLNPSGLQAEPEEALQMLAQIRLDEARLDIRDKGLLDLWARQSDMPSPDEAADQLAYLIESYLPKSGRALSAPLSDFLLYGGGLNLTIQPPQPMPLGMMTGFVLVPDMAIQQLQLRLTRTR
jgi:hypothetical protein